MGVRKDGVLLTDDVGGSGPGTSVDIVTPIGPNLAVDSVSFTFATDEGPIPVISTALPSIVATDTLSFAGDVIDIVIPDGYNTLLAWIQGNINYIGSIAFQNIQAGPIIIGSAYGLNLASGIRQANQNAITSANYLYLFAVVPGQTIRFTTSAYAGIGIATIVTTLSTSIEVDQPLTIQELRESPLDINLETIDSILKVTLADNYSPGDNLGVVNFGMYYDGITWDRMRGDSSIGLHVNLRDSVGNFSLPAIAALADNTVNPTLTKIATYPMLFDGITWDRARGDSVDGALVNLGANNDVVVTSLPAGLATTARQDLQLAQLAEVIGTSGVIAPAKVVVIGVVNDSDGTVRPLFYNGATGFIQVDVSNIDVPLSGRASEGTLGNLEAKFGTLGQKLMAGSAPVVLASDQPALPISATDLDIRNLDDDTDSITVSALVSDNPGSYTPDTLQNLSLTSEGLLRTENTVSRETLIWSNLDSNPFKQEDCGW